MMGTAGKKLFIIGYQGSEDIVDLAKDMSIFDEIEVIHNSKEFLITDINKYAENTNLEVFLFVNIENPREKLKILNGIRDSNYKIATLISPKASVASSAKIDVGCIVEPMAVVKSHAIIEMGCTISSGTIIENNVKIGKCSMIDYYAIIISNTIIPELTKIVYNAVINNSVITLNKKHRKD